MRSLYLSYMDERRLRYFGSTIARCELYAWRIESACELATRSSRYDAERRKDRFREQTRYPKPSRRFRFPVAVEPNKPTRRTASESSSDGGRLARRAGPLAERAQGVRRVHAISRTSPAFFDIAASSNSARGGVEGVGGRVDAIQARGSSTCSRPRGSLIQSEGHIVARKMALCMIYKLTRSSARIMPAACPF
jgi:hypothetical protein